MIAYVIYDEATGHILSAATAPDGQAPDEGPMGDGMAVLHGAADPARMCVQGGHIVARPAAELDAQDQALFWIAFRSERFARLASAKSTSSAFFSVSNTPRSTASAAMRARS